MKLFKIPLVFLVLLVSHAPHAEIYRLNGVYEITVPNDWLLVPRHDISKLKREASDIARNEKIELEVDLTDVSVPLFAYKEKSDGVYSARILVGPAELTKQDFENLTTLELTDISDEILKRQIEAFKIAKYPVFSSKSGLGKFKGILGIKTEIIYQNSKGLKVSRVQYAIYRDSVTLLVSLEHIALTGDPNYKLIEEQIAGYKVLAP